MLRIRWIVPAFLLILAPRPTLASCPTNQVIGWGNVGDDQVVESSARVWVGSVRCGSFNIDLTTGAMELNGGGGGGEYSCGTNMYVSDTYQVTGPPTATPLALEVHVHFSGSMSAYEQSYPYIGTVCNSSGVKFKITAGASSKVFTATPTICATQNVAGDLVLPLAQLPNEPFLLQYDLSAAGSTNATLHADLTFTLPAGYVLQSCQGYGGQPVATRPTSWGKLKQAYR